jgi:hypothetical protein
MLAVIGARGRIAEPITIVFIPVLKAPVKPFDQALADPIPPAACAHSTFG